MVSGHFLVQTSVRGFLPNAEQISGVLHGHKCITIDH